MKKFRLEKENTVFLFIDIQDKLVNSAFNSEMVYKNSTILAKMAEIMGIECLCSLQYPKGLGRMTEGVREPIKNSKEIEKTTFSCMLNEEFVKELENTGKKQIVICGVEAHICVLLTARDLLDAGYEVFIASDAVGSRSEFNYNNGLHQLNEMGCEITNIESVMFDLNAVAGTPTFKAVQKLII